MLDMIEEMDKKNKVLSSWTKERVGQVVTAKQAWNNFQTVLDNQQFHMNRQVTIHNYNHEIQLRC